MNIPTNPASINDFSYEVCEEIAKYMWGNSGDKIISYAQSMSEDKMSASDVIAVATSYVTGFMAACRFSHHLKDNIDKIEKDSAEFVELMKTMINNGNSYNDTPNS